MQTFLPFADFKKSARSLDRQRLGKQRPEGLQLIQGLLGKEVLIDPINGPRVVPSVKEGWLHHPASIMWERNILSLGVYTLAICNEWTSRGYLDTVKRKIELLIPGLTVDSRVEIPSWLGNEDFHRSHQSNLIRKLPSHYRVNLGWTEPDFLPYVWPGVSRHASESR